jgi:hypothetical protein
MKRMSKCSVIYYIKSNNQLFLKGEKSSAIITLGHISSISRSSASFKPIHSYAVQPTSGPEVSPIRSPDEAGNHNNAGGTRRFWWSPIKGKMWRRHLPYTEAARRQHIVNSCSTGTSCVVEISTIYGFKCIQDFTKALKSLCQLHYCHVKYDKVHN